MAIHELIEEQPTTAFAGAQRASKYIETAPTRVPSEEVNPTSAQESGAAQPTDVLQPAETVLVEPIASSDPLTAFTATEDDVDLGVLSVSAPERIARRGARGLLTKLGIRIGPGAAEQAATRIADAQRHNENTVRQATWTRAVSVLIANPKGGVGKTPTALLLGGVLAAVRGGSVCIMEVSDDPGALTFRSEGAPTRGLGQLVADAATIRSAGQLAGYTAPQTSFAAVIGSVGSRPRLEGPDVTAVATVVDDYFSIRVMDSGNQPSSGAFHAAVNVADVLVIPMFDAGDAALEAAALLDTLQEAGGRSATLAKTAIVLRLHDGRPENPQVVRRVDGILASYGIDHVHTIPYDPHIAERGQLSLGRLAAGTRHAITAAAADVVTTLHTAVR